MLRFFILAIALSTSALSASLFDWSQKLSPKAERARALLEGIDPLLEKALKEFYVPGVSVAVVVDGQVVLAKGYGMRDLDTAEPVDAETIFPIGSCTKSFTTFALGMLVHQGKLSWDRPVREILPQFQMFDAYATQHATLRDLVSNRTGLSRHDFMWYNSTMPREELLLKLRYLEPLYKFRERYYYNSLMYVIAGMALEKVAGQTWEEFVQTKIFDPLQMHSTHFSVKELRRGDNVASAYMDKGRGAVKKVPFRAFENVAPTAAINSNVVDLTHWIQMLLGSGMYEQQRLISAGGIQEMQSPQIISAGYPQSDQLLINSYGLGWDILSYRGHYCVGHDGGVDGFTSALCLLPHQNIGVVVLSNKNRSSLPRGIIYDIFDRLLELPPHGWLQTGAALIQKGLEEELQTEEKHDAQRKVGTMLTHPLASYEGFYEHPAYGVLLVQQKGDQLHATLHGITYVLNHWHYNVFSVAEEFPDILFSRKGEKVSFHSNLVGEIDEVAIPFDWGTSPIRFQRKPDERLAGLAYFRQFVGTYQYNKIMVEVSIRDRSLVAAIPGEPAYVLNPIGENEFQILEKPGYAIRFVKGLDGQVVEGRVIAPFGITFPARRAG